MKNILTILSFIVIIPFSLGDSDNKGCNSKDSKSTEEHTDHSDKTSENDKEKKINEKKPCENSFSTYPINSTD